MLGVPEIEVIFQNGPRYLYALIDFYDSHPLTQSWKDFATIDMAVMTTYKTVDPVSSIVYREEAYFFLTPEKLILPITTQCIASRERRTLAYIPHDWQNK